MLMNSAFLILVRDPHPIVERNKCIRGAGHRHLVTRLLKKQAGAPDHVQGKIFLPAILAVGAVVVAAVASIQNDRIHLFRALDPLRPQHRLDHFCQIHARNEHGASRLDDRVAEIELQPIDEELHGPFRPAQASHPCADEEILPHASHFPQPVKLRQIIESHMVPPAVFYHRPIRGARRSGAEQQRYDERMMTLRGIRARKVIAKIALARNFKATEESARGAPAAWPWRSRGSVCAFHRA